MAKKLFILGLPGCGKSKVARYITEFLERSRQKVIYFNDFEILKQMAESDTDNLFKRPENDAVFDVQNKLAFDIALKRLEQLVCESIDKAHDDKFYIIEFSRNNYRLAFSLLHEHAKKLFHPGFLADAHYIHLDTSVENCKKRIRGRASAPVYEDDYPVSDFIFKEYYHSDDGKDLPEILNPYGVDVSRAHSFPNNDTFEAISPSVIEAVSLMFEPGSDVRLHLEQGRGIPALI
ncbi:MAG TPA: ATP-binding protein [Ktedonobacteraceae bacterium]|nr:ATP-binding protein [Ktedonobacteraceae bacterium]